MATNPPKQHESLEHEVTHTLEEARMVLPGVQALFGFQLIVVYNTAFETLLSTSEQRLHLLGVLLTALTAILTMAPAAYHRQAEPYTISQDFVKLASSLLMAGMFTLMLSLWVDCYLIARVILKDTILSLLTVGTMGTVHVGLWFILPRLQTARHLP